MADAIPLEAFNNAQQYRNKPFYHFVAEYALTDALIDIIIPVESAIETLLHMVNLSNNPASILIYGTLAPECPDYEAATDLRNNWHFIQDNDILGDEDSLDSLTDKYSFLLLRMNNGTPGSNSNLRVRVRQRVES